MAAEIRSRVSGIVDPGTGTVKQNDDPVTVTVPTGTEPTNLVNQQSDVVTYIAEEHLAEPTGAASQITEPVVYEDGAVSVIRGQKARKSADVEDKAVTTSRTKRK